MKLKTLILLALAFIAAMDDGFAFQPYSANDVRAIEAGNQAAERILKETDFVKLTSLINELKAETNVLTRRFMLHGILVLLVPRSQRSWRIMVISSFQIGSKLAKWFQGRMVLS